MLIVPGLLLPAARADSPLPAHPDQIQYPPLEYRLPPATEFRQALSNGLVVFIAEDRQLPIVDLRILVRGGGAFDKPEKAGLSALVAEQLRDGGAADLSPEQVDEQVEFLAANVNFFADDTSASANLSCLSKDIDAGLKLLVDMLREPRFDEVRFRRAQDRYFQNIKRRNDATASIESIEWGFLLYGPHHFGNWYPTGNSIRAITRDDLFLFHHAHYHPANMIVIVTGDFERSEMISKLEQAFTDWPTGQPAPRELPQPRHEPQPGVYVINKPGVNQGRVSIGHIGIRQGSPDEYALDVMNAILGGGGFRSRLVSKVRSDEGLAYQVRSRFGQGDFYPGDFRCFFQSKSNSCAYATKLVMEEINRLRTEEVGGDELDDAVSFIVESFPQRFQTRLALLSAYARDEFSGRDLSFWPGYVENVRKVTSQDVLRVAKQYLHPEQLMILAVGDAEAILKGGYNKAADLRFDSFGPVTRWFPRDPETLER